MCIGRKRAIGVALVAVLFGPVFASRAAACTCRASEFPCESVWAHEAVFEATVTRADDEFVHLRDLKSWIGRPSDVVVATGDEASCGYKFEVGQRYLIGGSRQIDGLWRGQIYVSLCSLTTRIEQAGALLAYLRTLADAPPGGRVFGRLEQERLERPSLVPLEGGGVILLGPVARAAITDSLGGFEFSGLPVGEYDLWADPGAGFRLVPPRRVTLRSPHACAAVRALFTAVDGRITGNAVDSTGAPVAGVRLTLRLDAPPGGQGLSYRDAWSNAQGLFTFNDLPPGRYVIGVNLESGPTTYSPFALSYYSSSILSGRPTAAEAEVVTLDRGQVFLARAIEPVRLESLEVTGIVRWSDGRPAVGATIVAAPATDHPDPPNIVLATSDGLGQFLLADVFGGARYTITARIWREISPGVRERADGRIDLVVTGRPIDLRMSAWKPDAAPR